VDYEADYRCIVAVYEALYEPGRLFSTEDVLVGNSGDSILISCR